MVEFRWSVRATASSRGRVAVYVRKHQYEIGVPIQFDSEYPRITVLEYILGAFAADIVNGLTIAARDRRIVIDDIEAVIHVQLHNALTHLRVKGEEGYPGIKKIEGTVYVSSLAEGEVIESLWGEALDHSLLIHSLAPTVQVAVQLKLVT